MSKPRPPGRPSGDSSIQRDRLLDAALDCFAQAGIAASSLRAIAERAGVTPALVNYHFGNKEQLIDAVFSERLQPILLGIASRLQESAQDSGQLVAGLVRLLNEALTANPWFPPLWVREVLCEGGGLRPLWTQRIGPLIPARLAEHFSQAQARQALNPDLEPRLLVVSLFALVMLPHAAASLLQGIFPDADLRSAALTRHTLALLERGLEATP